MNSQTEAVLEDTQPGDALLDCLLLLAQSHDIRVSPSSILAGLPLHNEVLKPSLFHRAARHAGLASQIVRKPLQNLNQALFPVILLLHNDQACLLTGIDPQADKASVIYPELGKAMVEVSLAGLQESYAGRAIYARPEQGFENRVPPVTQSGEGHWFWAAIRENRKLYRDILVSALLINVFALAMPLFVMNVYDRVVPNFAMETLWVLALGIALVLCADFMLKMMRTWFVDLAASRVDIRVSSALMSRVLGMKMSEKPASVGSFAAGIQAFESVRSFIGSGILIAFVDFPFVLLFLLVIGLLTSWWLVLPIVVGIGVCLLYAASVQSRLHELSLNSLQASAWRNAVLVESLVGLEALKTQGAEGRMQRLWEKASIFLSANNSRMRLLSGSVGAGALLIQQLVAVSVIVVGVYLITEGEMSMGALIAAYLISSRIMAPVGQTAALLLQYHQARIALESAEETMAKEQDRPVGTEWLSRPRLSGEIEFREVSFSYPGNEKTVLDRVRLHIQSGEKVALLGRNGSGKSTLLKVLAGLYQASGGVLVDKLDIRQLDPAELRQNIAYMAQDVHLFMGTLRENLVLGDPDVSDERLLEIITACGIIELVNSHPQGLAMPVGERGELLSGGQRQGIALARALIRNPTILLLDEPTSSMDQGAEEKFKQNLARLSEHKTMLLVTHRNTMLSLADRIVVIDAGRIVADGPRDDVLAALREGRVGRAAT